MPSPSVRMRLSDAGQITMFVALIMGTFLIAFTGFATDYSNFWFQRQAAQGATDATCQAAAVDMDNAAAGNTSATGNFTPGATPVTCTSANPYPAPCSIAKYNGFDGTQSGTTVRMSFAQTLTGFIGTAALSYPFVTVDIYKQTPAYFSGLITPFKSVNIHTTATCGVVQQPGPGDILTLNPFPQVTGYSQTGGASVTVTGGSQIAIQVNSKATANSIFPAVKLTSGTVDLTKAGPNNNGDFGVSGAMSDPGKITYGTGEWLAPDLPEVNPYASVTAPNKPANGGFTQVLNGTHGCTDTVCAEFTQGYYSTGITIPFTSGNGKNATTYKTAIFDPGIYYLDGSFTVGTGGTVRMATGYDQHYGLMFYIHSNGTFNITSAVLTDAVASTTLTCDGSAPSGLPASVAGDSLRAQCTTDGTYTTANGNFGNSTGTIRGILFFQDPSIVCSYTSPTNQTNCPIVSAATLGSTVVQGTGLMLAGNLYFHTSSYADVATFGGATTTALYGRIVTDKLIMNGASPINVGLSGAQSPLNIRVAMLQ